ncbi:HU family DNA-binding protein [Desulfosarcina sp.]|uniref:HU family DNA-binding protein n=1 Tax=Desulfosarcina sp. TaxID=2027861 RepID=UPI0029AE8688|nr:HU family DNA-binding protein [Desulfosarcina sp.]MDX2454793.1 HU family DNA-binding protein [Desulfosarcina sp.]MDX2492397.1 HU family DNA-binding protein [Desulfosarcina sp.]
MALTKNDIVAKVNDLGFTKKNSIETVESLLEIVKGTLEDGDDLLVSGFGKFCVKEKKKRRDYLIKYIWGKHILHMFLVNFLSITGFTSEMGIK